MYYGRALRILILIERNVLVRLTGVAFVFVCFDFDSMNYLDLILLVLLMIVINVESAFV